MAKKTANGVLRAWAAKNGLGPRAFAAKVDISYRHAWGLLRGRSKISGAMLGRLLIYLGDDGPARDVAAVLRRDIRARKRATLKAALEAASVKGGELEA